MINIENVEVYGWEAAIRGMRNPMNSWDKSDSVFSVFDTVSDDVSKYEWVDAIIGIGHNDFDLMTRLSNAGTEHRKFMRMINVTMDISAPLYWWKEFDTYKVGTVANSCSTMHKIHAKEFTMDDFSYEHLIEPAQDELANVIQALNEYREWYLKYDHMKEEDKVHFYDGITCKKDLWWQLIQLLPSSYNQKRTVQLNYEVLAGMYRQRKDHKLDEWHAFCDTIEMFPCSELIIGKQL